MFGWLASGLEKIAETAERPDNISRRRLFKIGGALAAVGLLNTYCGGDSDGGDNGGGNPQPPTDTTPPASIDLYAYQSSQNGEEVNLVWQSPGDDNLTGTPDYFIIRYSVNPILTETDWDNATDLASINAVGPAGTNYDKMLQCPAGNWYFAIKTLDEANNKSGVSGFPQGTPVAVPSKAEFYVDKWIDSGGDINLNYNEIVAMVQGEGSIPSYSRDLAVELIKCSGPSFPGIVDDLENGLLTATNGIVSPTDEEYWGINTAFLWDAPTNRVRTYYEPIGNAIDYNNLDTTTMNNVKNSIRDFLIQYVDAHKADYGDLNPSFNPSW